MYKTENFVCKNMLEQELKSDVLDPARYTSIQNDYQSNLFLVLYE